jgi:RNA polymerase-interacting CarD/CdnL/TRCF family regulator
MAISQTMAYSQVMDRDHTDAPETWIEALAASDADIARGDIVSAAYVHARLIQAINDLEAEMAAAPSSESALHR